MFNFRRRETPWEVVDSKAVDPVPLYYDFEDDGALVSCSHESKKQADMFHYQDLEIVTVGDADTRGTYVFEGNQSKKSIDPRDAVVFAQQQLLKEAVKKGFNILLLERYVFIVNDIYFSH
jgi:hypothetical protein